VYEQHASLISFLSELQIPMPTILRVSAGFVLGNAIQRCLTDERLDLDRIRRLLDTARQDATGLAGCSLKTALGQRLERVLDGWAKAPFDLGKLWELEAVVSLAHAPPFDLDLWRAQNVYYQLLQVISREQHVRYSKKWLDHFQKLGDLLGVAVGDSLHARASASLKVEPMSRTPGLVQATCAARDAVMMGSHELQIPAGP